MSDTSSSSFRYCSKGCNTRMTKVTYDSHTICSGCRGQVCSINLTCDKCRGWGEQKWKTLNSHLAKPERDRKRKAAAKPSDRLASQALTPRSDKADISVNSLNINPSPPASVNSPNPPTPSPGSNTSKPDRFTSLGNKFERRVNLVVSIMAQLGASVCVLMERLKIVLKVKCQWRGRLLIPLILLGAGHCHTPLFLGAQGRSVGSAHRQSSPQSNLLHPRLRLETATGKASWKCISFRQVLKKRRLVRAVFVISRRSLACLRDTSRGRTSLHISLTKD